jgi:5'-3' exonuclease
MVKKKKKSIMKVLLLDGYNLIYRSRYSRMNKGDYSTIFNFFRSLRPLVEKFDPDVCYFVLEGIPKKRLEISPDYKGQRVYHDKDNFQSQKKEIIRLLKEYFPFKIIKHDDYECDDVIAHIATQKHHNENVTIVSSDTDFIQIISSNIKLYNPVRKCFLEKTEYNYVDWKSLVGDKSDNIIGFNGIGNKKAQKLLSNKELLENFLTEENNREKFNKNKFMIKFHDLVDEEKNFVLSENKIFNWDLLKKEFINFKFNSIIGKDKSWEKYIQTFKSLERNINNDD